MHSYRIAYWLKIPNFMPKYGYFTVDNESMTKNCKPLSELTNVYQQGTCFMPFYALTAPL